MSCCNTKSWTYEVESSVPAARMFKATILEWHNLAPKLMPNMITSATILPGDYGVGVLMRQINFSPAMPFSYVKERMEYTDNMSLECKVSQVEGGKLGIELKSLQSLFRFEPRPGGGCLSKVVTSYKLMPGVADGVDEVKAAMAEIFKATEAYLIANPTAFF